MVRVARPVRDLNFQFDFTAEQSDCERSEPLPQSPRSGFIPLCPQCNIQIESSLQEKAAIRIAFSEVVFLAAQLKGSMSSVRARLSASQGIDEVPHFVVEISRVAQRLCDLGACNVPKAATQAMDRDFQRAFAETKLGSSVGLWGA